VLVRPVVDLRQNALVFEKVAALCGYHDCIAPDGLQ
jgi:hypothetical protein